MEALGKKLKKEGLGLSANPSSLGGLAKRR
jgi:hypothetical protein